MPIYAYRCSTCGHAKDVLQKMSDPVLTDCPACGASTFLKQVTAAGFQLKGSGWYVTDFRGGDKPTAAKPGDGANPDTPKADTPKADTTAPAGTSGSDSAPAPSAAPAPTPAPAPAAPKAESK